jgi:hypothetical protein
MAWSKIVLWQKKSRTSIGTSTNGLEQDCVMEVIVQDIYSTSINGPEQNCAIAAKVQDIHSTFINGLEQNGIMVTKVQDICCTFGNGLEQDNLIVVIVRDMHSAFRDGLGWSGKLFPTFQVKPYMVWNYMECPIPNHGSHSAYSRTLWILPNITQNIQVSIPNRSKIRTIPHLHSWYL